MTIKADDDEDLTELEKFAPTRLDGVDMPATGASFLMLKALGAEPAPESTEKAVAAVPEADPQAPEAPAQDAPATPEPEAQAPAEAAKSAAPAPDPGMVNVDIPAGASVSISPADLAKLATLKQQLALKEAALAKRDMDPDVGGGVDRDKLPDSAYVFPATRDFPVVEPGDVSDAVSSWGRYKGKESFASFRAKLTALARRKGPKFAAELPKAWTDGSASKAGGPAEGEAEKAGRKKGGKGKAFPGAAPPFKADKDGDGEPHEGKDGNGGTEGEDADGKAEKSGAACKGCGGDMAKDAKFCANCGEKAGDKAEKSAGCGCGEPMAKDARFCGSCGEPAGGRAEKARACKCGAAMAKGQKFCTDCGTKAGKATKGKIPSPEDAAVAGAIDRAKEAIGDALDAQDKDPDKDSHPADAKVEAYLDEAKHAIGNAEDAQEEDIDEDDPAAHGMGKAAAAGDDGIPYHLTRLHDATCAAYRHEDVIIAHPAVAKGIGELVDPQAFARMTEDALREDGGSGSRASEIPALSEAFRHAVTLKSLAAAGGLDEAMEDVRKAFAEYYPDAHPSPGAVSPGEFRRPYVSTGRANQSAKPGQEPRVPLSTHVPEPSDFRRPLITAGREAASPGSDPKPNGLGKARQYYTNAARDGATQALTSMHDWIADNHPGVCAMTGSAYDGEPGQANSMGSSLTTAKPVPAQFALTRDKASPVPVGAAAASAAVTPSVTKAERKAAAKAARKAAEMAQAPEAPAAEAAPAVPAAPAIDPELLKSMFREVVAEELGGVIKANGELAQRVADLESAPDPAQMAPRSGAGMAKNAATASQEVPAGGDGFAVERIVRLVKRAADPDSGVRTAAIGELFDMVPREEAVRLLEAAY